LEELAISDFFIDNDRKYARVKHVLITDTLLWALTRHPNVPLLLIPGLRSIQLQSLLLFNQNVLLYFMLSQIQPARPFEITLLSLPGHHRPLDETVAACVEVFRLYKKLRFFYDTMK
jgi:hypothetical protein